MAKLEYLNTVWSNFVSLTDCQKEIENKQVCNAETLLINSNVQFFFEYIDKHSEIFGNLYRNGRQETEADTKH